MARDPLLDVVLSDFRAKPDPAKPGDEGFKVEVVSYDQHEPRIKVTRYYVDDDGRWREDLERYRRMSFRLLHALIVNQKALDRGFAKWQDSGGRKTKPETSTDF